MSSSQLTPRSAYAPSMLGAWQASRVPALNPRDVMLVTDFDGTLAEIVPDPALAAILPASLEALSRLSTLLRRVVVLSSRPTGDLRGRVPVAGVDLIGDSGLSRITADERRRLDRFNAEAARLLARVPGVWLEIKPGATAIHHRQSPASAADLLAIIGHVVDETDLKALPGRRVVEVTPCEAPKGEALEALVGRLMPEGLVCIGDDENDRPMFEFAATLDRPHLIVGAASAEAHDDLFASCDLVVAGPREVSELLTLIADWATNDESERPGA